MRYDISLSKFPEINIFTQLETLMKKMILGISMLTLWYIFFVNHDNLKLQNPVFAVWPTMNTWDITYSNTNSDNIWMHIIWDIKNNLTDQNTTNIIWQNTQSWNKAFTWRCVRSSDANIFIYMYHYFREQSQAGKSIKWDSINQENIDNQINILNNKIKNKQAISSSMQDLQKYQKSNCFPNSNIVILTVDDWRYDWYSTISRLTQQYPNIYRNLGIIAGKVNTGASRNMPFMNQSDIQSLINTNKVFISSHTMTHLDLKIQSDQNLKYELCNSKKLLQNMFWQNINTIIYPAWSKNQKVVNQSKKCWYIWWLTTTPWYNSGNYISNNFNLYRIRVSYSTNAQKLFDFDYQKNKNLPDIKK